MILDPNGISNAAGQGKQQADNANTQSAAHGQQSGDQTSLLLFRAGGSELKAVPLESVARIEEVDAAAIEHVGGRPVVQYRQHLMPLITITDGHQWKDDGKQPLLVFDKDGRSLGIVVDEVVDIARDQVSIDLTARTEGLLGSAIVAGKATDLIDIEHHVARNFARWFSTSQVKLGEAA
jgi:two-component system chemotaxis sensor kinase CheA